MLKVESRTYKVVPLWKKYQDGLYLAEYTPEVYRDIANLKRELSELGEVVDVRIKPMGKHYITATMAGLVAIHNHSEVTLKVVIYYEVGSSRE